MHLLILLYASFASVFTIGKFALLSNAPLFFVGTRMTLAGVLLGMYALWKYGTVTFKLNTQQWISLLLLGVVNIYITNALEFWGLKHLSSTKTCFFYSLSPFIAALFSFLLFNEMMSKRQWLGLVIGFLGFMPVIFGSPEPDNDLSTFLLFSWPELAIFTAVVASALGWILLKQAIQKHEIASSTANSASMLLGGIMITVNSYALEAWEPFPVGDPTVFFICTLALIIISNFFCYNLYAYLFKKFSATFISFVGFITPAFVALYGTIFLDEQIPFLFYPSFAIVSVGIFLFYQEELYAKKIESSQAVSA